MSHPTHPAFVHYGTWDSETRSVPPLKFLEDYTRDAIDSRLFAQGGPPPNHLITEDMVLVISDGSAIEGAEATWKVVAETYGPFSAHRHDPTFLNSWETADGYGAVGAANLYFNLHGPTAESVTDPKGEKWQGDGPGAFLFEFVKQGDNIKLKKIQLFVDSTPALKAMLKNKHITGDQLAGIVTGG